MDITPQLLQSIEDDFKKAAPVLEAAIQQVLDEGITRYPVFVLHTGGAKLGAALAPWLAESGLEKWQFNLSPLEELVAKGVLERERVTDFKRQYLDPTEKACLLVADAASPRVIFLPYDLP